MRSGHLEIGTSGDRQGRLTTESRRRGAGRRNLFSDHQITRSRAITRSFMFLNRAMQAIRAALREIFDESAYDRFLLRTCTVRSVTSYRAFVRERDAAMMKKPRCC
jgi:hypothetical protein